jgi:hypothetical protein
MKNLLRRFYLNPFEANVAVFVIVNAILTFFPQSWLLFDLWSTFGIPAIVVPIIQSVAGILMFLGIGLAAANLEVAGLILVSAMFAVRFITLIDDGNITLSDINNSTIAILIIAASAKRVIQLIRGVRIIP